MLKDSNKKYQSNQTHSHNETQNRNHTNNDIFQDSEEIECTDSQSIILDKMDQRMIRPSQYSDEILKTQRKELSTDGQFKDSLREKKITDEKKIQSQNQFQQSQFIQDSIKKSQLKSQILAHFKLGEDQQVFRIDVKNQKNQILSGSKNLNQPKSPHWQPIQIPQDLFKDEEIIEEKRKNVNKGQAKKIEHKKSKQSNKDLTKEENPINNENLLNPFMYFNNLRQQQNPVSFSCNQFNQPTPNINCQSQNPLFPPPNMGQLQFHQNISPMQYSQTANCLPPFSPRSEAYWQPGPPQQQYPSYSPFYGGAQLMNEMRYLREEVKMLRDSINYERGERQFQMRYKRQNDKDLEKFQRIVLDMKNTIEKERQQHKKQLQEISSKFLGQITKLRDANASLQQQNQTLRMISQSSSKGRSQTYRLNFRQRNGQNSDKKSSRKMRNLEEILDKKIYTTKNTQETLSRKIRTSKQIQPKKKPQITPKRRKYSEKKYF